jgi:hypothetical protein
LEVLKDDANASLRDQTLTTFRDLFGKIEKAQRDALRDNNRELKPPPAM